MTATTDFPINSQCCANQDSTIIKYRGKILCKKCFDHKYLFATCNSCKVFKSKQELEIIEKNTNGEKRYFCTLKCYKKGHLQNFPVITDIMDKSDIDSIFENGFKNTRKTLDNDFCIKNPIEKEENSPDNQTIELYVEPEVKPLPGIYKFDSRHFKNPVELATGIGRFELTKRITPPALIFFYNESNKHIVKVFSDIKGRIHPSITIGIVDADLYSFRRFKRYINLPSILFFHSREKYEESPIVFDMSCCINFVEDICTRENLYKRYILHEYIHELDCDQFYRKKTNDAGENLYLKGYCDEKVLVFFYRDIDAHYISIFNNLVVYLRNPDVKIPMIIGVLNVKNCQEIFLDKITEPRVWLYIGKTCSKKLEGEITFENLVNFLK